MKHKTPIKSILKGEPLDDIQQKNQVTDLEEVSAQKTKKSNIINNINGNVVHVTVNNFITSDKKN